MTTKNTKEMGDIEWAIGSAVRSLMARNAEIAPTNIIAELSSRPPSQNMDEAAKIKVAIAWLRNRIN